MALKIQNEHVSSHVVNVGVVPDHHQSEKPQDEPEYLKGFQLFILIFTLILVVLLMCLDVSIVATALPRITDTFNTISDIGWYGAAFSFTNAALQPMAGKIYTYFPMKWSFVTFVLVFELGSLFCATAVSSAMFIVGRAIAGIGSSGLVNGALLIIATATPPSQKPMFMGLVVAVAGAGQLLGPLIGGALTEHASWRWCFWINLPAGAITVIFLIFVTFPNKSVNRKSFSHKTVVQDFDLVGFAIFTPTIIMLMLALQWGGTTYPWNSAVVLSLLVISFAVLLPMFIYQQHRYAGLNAMFPTHILKQRQIYSACIANFFFGGSLLIVLYYLPLWFQTIKSASSFTSSIDTLPSIISQIFGSIIAGTLCPRVCPYLTPFALAGSILSLIGSTLLATLLNVGTSTATWIGIQILCGVGRGLGAQIPVQIAQQHLLPKPKSEPSPSSDKSIASPSPTSSPSSTNYLATGTAIISFSQFFGGSLFLALGQTTFSNLLKHYLHAYAPNIDADAVLKSGATEFLASIQSQTEDNLVLHVKMAYNGAIVGVFWVLVGASVVMVGSVFGMGWGRVEIVRKGEDSGTRRES